MTRTPVLVGIDAVLVSVEVTLVTRLPSVVITGLSAVSVRETADRVRSAMEASGLPFPRKRVEVALGNPDLRKDGTGVDLAVAAAIIQAANPSVVYPPNAAFLGELTLGGEVRCVRGAAIHARQHPGVVLVCPVDMARTVVAMGGKAIGIRMLGQLLELPPVEDGLYAAPTGEPLDQRSTPRLRVAGSALDAALAAHRAPRARLDFADCKGASRATLDALADAARTRKTVLLVGPPGCGKTMLAARCPGLMHDMDRGEVLTTASIRDAAGLLSHDQPLTLDRPFRAPHHSISPAGLVGGAMMRPGEVNLAHAGVLFLDEVTEFPRHALEVLRGALEDGETRLRKVDGTSARIPAQPWLLLAANPCPCGMTGHPTRPCTCSSEARLRYDARLEQALQFLGGEALTLFVRPVEPSTLLGDAAGPTTATLRDAARARAQAHVERVLAAVRPGALTREGVAGALGAAWPPTCCDGFLQEGAFVHTETCGDDPADDDPEKLPDGLTIDDWDAIVRDSTVPGRS